ncbi:MAG: hypothetical protein RQ733_06115 [Methyloprofundus sp.]|nr:hypothetical protein [Methyloprofundus sp.]MDT8425533.1 hypothetical protein [Methyloprofundus sp.]
MAVSPTLFAHAGVDHGDNCFIDIGGFTLRLGAFQAADKIGGGKHFCHILPATGTVIFTFEQDVVAQLNKKMNLKFLAADSYADLIFNNATAFNQTLAQVSNAAAIDYDFPKAGLYALEVSLHSDELEPSANNTQRLLFLVGFPIIKMLVFTALGFLLMLGFVLFSQLKAGVKSKK